jgi:hypothetical protein
MTPLRKSMNASQGRSATYPSAYLWTNLSETEFLRRVGLLYQPWVNRDKGRAVGGMSDRGN